MPERNDEHSMELGWITGQTFSKQSTFHFVCWIPHGNHPIGDVRKVKIETVLLISDLLLADLNGAPQSLS